MNRNLRSYESPQHGNDPPLQVAVFDQVAASRKYQRNYRKPIQEELRWPHSVVVALKDFEELQLRERHIDTVSAQEGRPGNGGSNEVTRVLKRFPSHDGCRSHAIPARSLECEPG